jgi:hypothetical protein
MPFSMFVAVFSKCYDDFLDGILTMRTRIKICGLTREEDVDAAVAAGADAIGFVFYPPSPRYVTPQRAAELVRRIPPLVDVVGLFVNEGRRLSGRLRSPADQRPAVSRR